MLNFKNLLARTFLAFALASGAGAALAGPTYHVDIDTSALAGSSGYLDFLIQAQLNAAAASATLTHLTGDFTGLEVLSGEASGSAATGATIGNSDFFNGLSLWSNFGGHFSFDVSFDVADSLSGIGSALQVALYDSAYAFLAPTTGNIAEFYLQSGEPIGLMPSAFATISLVPDVSDVPEPADWMMMATGLALLGFTLRRRVR